jgi:uroporphyrinogen decarboxylase
MNSKQRIINILDRKPVDRIPVDIWHTPEVEKMLIEYVNASDDFEMWKKLGLDKIVWVFMDYKTPSGQNAGSQVGAKATGSRTMWGVPLKDIKAGEAHYQEFVENPMRGYTTPEEAENYPFWPDPDLFDYESAINLAKRAAEDFAVIGPWVSFFEIYCQLRGIENALMDMLAYPDMVSATLDRIEAIQTQMLRTFLGKAAKYVDMVFISDDIGSQNNLLISPENWEYFLQPRMKRWCDLIHSYGVKVFYHTDGASEKLITPLIECGIDVLNPIQHVCQGMEMDGLKKKYGNKLIFHGGVDNQYVLPFGSVKEVQKETLNCLETLGKGREGFICCSCHNIQAGTPVENIIAMIETVKSW